MRHVRGGDCAHSTYLLSEMFRSLFRYYHPLYALMSSLKSYQMALIEHSMSVEALKFGSFTLKSGRRVIQYLFSLVNNNLNSFQHIAVLF